eukprot:14166231-Alexandrium_andersonii.AAC.1
MPHPLSLYIAGPQVGYHHGALTCAARGTLNCSEAMRGPSVDRGSCARSPHSAMCVASLQTAMSLQHN